MENKKQLTVKWKLALIAAGFPSQYSLGDSLDSEYLAKVKEFQKENGLIPDGIIGEKTSAKLRYIADKKATFRILVIHCSATKEGLPVTAKQIEYYHTVTKGWSRAGYSDVIELDGKIVNLRKWDDDDQITEWEYTNGILGELNKKARHICYSGGLDEFGENPKDTRTVAQLHSMESYVKDVIAKHPNVIIVGHNQIQQKACPSFYVPDWLTSIGIEPKNIGTFKLY